MVIVRSSYRRPKRSKTLIGWILMWSRGERRIAYFWDFFPIFRILWIFIRFWNLRGISGIFTRFQGFLRDFRDFYRIFGVLKRFCTNRIMRDNRLSHSKKKSVIVICLAEMGTVRVFQILNRTEPNRKKLILKFHHRSLELSNFCSNWCVLFQTIVVCTVTFSIKHFISEDLSIPKDLTKKRCFRYKRKPLLNY